LHGRWFLPTASPPLHSARKCDLKPGIRHSLKEVRETIYWLRLLQATGQCENDDLRLLAQEADEISRSMGAIIVKTKTKRKDK